MDFSRLTRYPSDEEPKVDERDDFESQIDRFVERFVRHLLANPTAQDRELFEALRGWGISHKDAWRLLQFVQIAFVHAVFAERGVQFQSGYIIADWDRGTRTQHILRCEPVYRAAFAVARRLMTELESPSKLWPIFGRSAEWNGIQQVAGDDFSNLHTVVLCEPLLSWPYHG